MKPFSLYVWEKREPSGNNSRYTSFDMSVTKWQGLCETYDNGLASGIQIARIYLVEGDQEYGDEDSVLVQEWTA